MLPWSLVSRAPPAPSVVFVEASQAHDASALWTHLARSDLLANIADPPLDLPGGFPGCHSALPALLIVSKTSLAYCAAALWALSFCPGAIANLANPPLNVVRRVGIGPSQTTWPLCPHQAQRRRALAGNPPPSPHDNDYLSVWRRQPWIKFADARVPLRLGIRRRQSRIKLPDT